MTHYICTGGCGGVSEKPGKCDTEGCPLHGHPLIPCDCTDGKHTQAFEKAKRTKSSVTKESIDSKLL